MLLAAIPVVLLVPFAGGTVISLPLDTTRAAANVAGAGVTTLLALGAAWMALEWLVFRRVAALVLVAERFSAGDRSQRADPDGADEIGRLARSFNATADRLTDLLAAQQQTETSSAFEVDEVVLRRMFEMGLLNQFASALQTCKSVEEAYAVIPELTSQLLPEYAGALYVLSDSCDSVEVKASWGDLPDGYPNEFPPAHCHALDENRLHVVQDDLGVAHCTHVAAQPARPYLCIPLMTHGESLGVLHLRRSHSAPELEQDLAGETGYALAEAVADHIALNLGNLRLREILRLQSIHDPLTGLFNRRYLEESIARELSRASRDRYAVGIVVLDIDHFKRFNDTYGHDAGDAVLIDIGTLLSNGIRGGDIPCRYGGEEFVAILPGAPIEATRSRAEQLRRSIERHRVTHRDQVLDPVTVSLGVAVYPDHGNTFEELFRAADTALYEAKRDGRNQVRAAAFANDEAAELQGEPSVTRAQ